MNGQTKRILAVLLEHKGREVPSVDLHRAGSGKDNGFCGSFSRRISDIREMCYAVDCRKETVAGQLHTFYTLNERIQNDMPQMQVVAQGVQSSNLGATDERPPCQNRHH